MGEKETMGKGEDRISDLPDPILQLILTLMPLKSAIRTDVLSKRWRNLWQYSLSWATGLEFGEDFASSQSAKEFVRTVNRYLQLNQSKKLIRFQVFFCPFDLFANDIETWINYAASKRVEHLDIDLSQGFKSPDDCEFYDGRSPFELPASMLDCCSLIDLSLSRCDFGIPLNLSNFGGLQSLSLSYSNINEQMLQNFLANCPLLENLCLIKCEQLEVISILLPGLKLKKLTIGFCHSADLLEIDAPKLQSLHYFGKLCSENSFLNISSLEEVSIYPVNPMFRNLQMDYSAILSDLSHVQILNLSSTILVDMSLAGDFGDGQQLQLLNLQELQLLFDSLTHEDLGSFYLFLNTCASPLLEKLFIHLPAYIEDPNERRHEFVAMLNPQDVKITLSNLKVIKLTNFIGTTIEMKLVSFLLDKATVLESLTLVLPQTSNINKGNGKERLVLSILRGRVLLLARKSAVARIIVHEFGEDEGINPTYKDIHKYYKSDLPNIPCMLAGS
ncbi:hypothetical protein HPP92_017621 [Vanilla planifolia]|uniref:F-box domain-containing protein n=2 Tax=Vanilla planifolia TaxID=51239 RepID=A0A835UTA6_VANPL|nr:hypothetical protein HPP92_017621 [Vanilla planifolia]